MDKIREKIAGVIGDCINQKIDPNCIMVSEILILFPTHLFAEKIGKVGRFTFARVKETIGKKVLTGIGISRLSDNDTYRKDVAEKIALGRAKKALEMKKNKQPIHNLLMG